MSSACHEVVVRFRDLDALGHVNYSVYLSYLEDALNRLWISALSAVKKEFEVRDPGIVTVRAEIDYRAPALCHQTLVVEIWVSAIGNRSFTTDYRVVEKLTGLPLIEASTVQVITIPGERERQMPSLIRSVLKSYSRNGTTNVSSDLSFA